MSSFMAAGTAYSIHNIPMIPFYLFYSMFGFQRVGDLIWACGDILCKGFLLGGTAGRTTLNGEGLQHQDGHSHVIAETVPNLKVMIQHLITSWSQLFLMESKRCLFETKISFITLPFTIKNMKCLCYLR